MCKVQNISFYLVVEKSAPFFPDRHLHVHICLCITGIDLNRLVKSSIALSN